MAVHWKRLAQSTLVAGWLIATFVNAIGPAASSEPDPDSNHDQVPAGTLPVLRSDDSSAGPEAPLGTDIEEDWPSRWVIETIAGEKGDEQIAYENDIAVGSNGEPQISYVNQSDGFLYYATVDGLDWVTQAVDTSGGAGRFSSIGVNGEGEPVISYYDQSQGDLKVATLQNRSTARWEIVTVDAEGDVGVDSDLVIDSAGNPHISYYAATEKQLRYARWDGTTWITTEIGTNHDIGYYTSIDLDSSNRPHIASYDYDDGNLVYITFDGANWLTETIALVGDVGVHPDLKLDNADQPHISYYDFDNGELEYATFDIVGGTWETATIDAGEDVGRYSAISLDENDIPHIAYYDDGHQRLNLAYLAGSNWITETIDQSAQVGQYASLILDEEGEPHLTYLDETGSRLRYGSAFLPSVGIRDILAHENDSFLTIPIDVTEALTQAGSFELSLESGSGTVGEDVGQLGNRLVSIPVGVTRLTVTVPITNDFVIEGTETLTLTLSNPVNLFLRDEQAQIHLYDDDVYTWEVDTPLNSFAVMDGLDFAVDPNGNRHLIFQNQADSFLYYGYGGDHQLWSTVLVDGSADVGASANLHLDASGLPHLSYYDFDNQQLKYGFLNESGIWTIEVVDASADVGLDNVLRLDQDGVPVIAYVDSSSADLKIARRSGGIWQSETIDSVGAVGWTPDLAIAADNQLFVVYYDTTETGLKLARSAGVGQAWTMTMLDALGDVGFQPSLQVDPAGQLHMTYHDSTHNQLRYGLYRPLDGSFAAETIAEIDDVPDFEANLVLDAGLEPMLLYTANNGEMAGLVRRQNNLWYTQIVVTDSARRLTQPRIKLDQNQLPALLLADSLSGDILYYTVDLPILSIADGAAYESAASGLLTTTISLDAPYFYPVTATLTISSVSATANADFIAPAVQTVSIPQGATDTVISINLVDDGLAEQNETLIFELSQPQYAQLGHGTSVGTIYDDDSPPQLSMAAVTVFENAGTLDVRLALDKPTLQTAEVTLNLTATMGSVDSDLGPLPDPRIRLDPNQQVVTYSIPLLDNNQRSADKRFLATLSDPTNMTILSETARLMIKNDDGWQDWAFGSVTDNGAIQDGDMVLDPLNQPHLVYRDRVHNQLIYSVYDRSTNLWIDQIVPTAGDIDSEPRLVLTSDGAPIIAYIDRGTQVLTLMRLVGTTWSSTTLTQEPLATRFDMGLTPNQVIYIAYRNRISGALNLATVVGSSRYTESIGINHLADVDIELEIDQNGWPIVATPDRDNNQILFASKQSGGWESAHINLDERPSVDIGLALDSNQLPHFTSYAESSRSISYIRQISGTWKSEILDTGERSGLFSDIAIDSTDRVHISYFDAAHSDLMYAVRSGKSWRIETANGDESRWVGYRPVLKLSSENGAVIAHIDLTDDQLMVSHLPLPLTSNDPSEPAQFVQYLPYVKGERRAPDLVIHSVDIQPTDIEIVVANWGTAPITNSFWVDLYINPHTVPSGPNQVWWEVGSEGLVWGIETEAELEVGESLTLTLTSESYRPELGSFSGTFDPGDTVYIQVDSLGEPDQGNVLELHELLGLQYNNIWIDAIDIAIDP